MERLPPTYVEYPSTSVITIHARSSGHHRFGDVNQPLGSKPHAASSGPRNRK
jgi:hypothetical protein